MPVCWGAGHWPAALRGCGAGRGVGVYRYYLFLISIVGRSGYEPLALSCDMAADYSAVCLAIELKFDLVHPVIDSTAISNGHISASGSDRAPDAPNQQIRRSSGWGAAVGRNSRAQSQGSGT